MHDSVQAKAVLNEAGALAKAVDEKIASVTADKAYDSAAIVEFIEDLGATAVIPPLSNRKNPRAVDWAQYKNRNLIERFFARLKQFRRAATRYDKLAARFLSLIHLAAAYIWLA